MHLCTHELFSKNLLQLEVSCQDDPGIGNNHVLLEGCGDAVLMPVLGASLNAPRPPR